MKRYIGLILAWLAVFVGGFLLGASSGLRLCRLSHVANFQEQAEAELTTTASERNIMEMLDDGTCTLFVKLYRTNTIVSFSAGECLVALYSLQASTGDSL